MSGERERAEQLFSYIHYHSGEKGIDAILAFAREERARVWEEVEQILESESENVEYMDREAQHLLDRLCKRIAKQHAKALREEGGQ